MSKSKTFDALLASTNHMKSLNTLRDKALRVAIEHGFKDASPAECIALIHSELSEALECLRDAWEPDAVWYEKPLKAWGQDGDEITLIDLSDCHTNQDGTLRKPCGVPSEMADVIIRVFHFCGKYGIDIEKAVCEKIAYNETRPFMHGKKL